MGIQYVKTIQELNTANRLFFKRVEGIQSSILFRLANLNFVKSKQVAEEVKFKGVLMSMIELKPLGKLKFQVIASAPHAYGIETGTPPIAGGGYIPLEGNPLLEEWVRLKLMQIDPAKAEYFLRRGAVLVGKHGYPYGYPKGIKFMGLGAGYAVDSSVSVIAEELTKI